VPAGSSGSNSRVLLRDVEMRNKSGSFKRSMRGIQGAREVRFASPVDFVPPARPGEIRCPCCRRRRGNRARWPLSVTMIAVTGTVQAVGGTVTGTVAAVTRGRDPCSGSDRLRAAVTAVAGCPR
jgi:hypothetical protein